LVDWSNQLVQNGKGDNIYSELRKRWNEIVNNPNLKQHFPRLNGVFYEALFYYCVIKQVCLYRQGTWFVLQGWMEMPQEGPIDLEIVPIFEVVPRLLIVDGKRVAPQVNADFLILYPSKENRTPVWLIDVKSSKSFLNSIKELEKLEWQFTGANYYGGNFQVAYPKSDHAYPKHLNDWIVIPKGAQTVDELVRQSMQPHNK